MCIFWWYFLCSGCLGALCQCRISHNMHLILGDRSDFLSVFGEKLFPIQQTWCFCCLWLSKTNRVSSNWTTDTLTLLCTENLRSDQQNHIHIQIFAHIWIFSEIFWCQCDTVEWIIVEVNSKEAKKPQTEMKAHYLFIYLHLHVGFKTGIWTQWGQRLKLERSTCLRECTANDANMLRMQGMLGHYFWTSLALALLRIKVKKAS